MRRPAPWILAAAAAVLTGTATGALAQADRVPTSLALEIGAREALQGAPVPITVALRNYRNEPIQAPEAIVVTLVSELTEGPARVVIPSGRASAKTSLVFHRAGVAKVIATARDLPSAYGIIAIKPRGTDRSLLDGLPPLLATAVNGLFPRLTAAPAQPAVDGPRLWVEVLPPRISPRGGTWTGLVVVGLADAAGNPLEATGDVPVRLAAELGAVSPDQIVIARGSTTATADVRVVSNAPGQDVVHAVSLDTGDRAARDIEYERPRPARLFVTATPAEAVSNGRTRVQIAVLLKDADHHVVPNPGGDVRVLLESSLGFLSQQAATIASGRPDSDVVALASSRAGRATITAYAEGLEGHEVVVRFAVPWLFIVLACAGGTAGAVVRSKQRHTRGAFAGDLAMGALLGVACFACTLFGIPGVLPIPAETLDHLALNEIGACLLGLLGGYTGREFLARLAAARLPERRPAAASSDQHVHLT